MDHPDTPGQSKALGTETTSRTGPPGGMAERAVAQAAARYAAAEHELRQARFEQALRRAAAQT